MSISISFEFLKILIGLITLFCSISLFIKEKTKYIFISLMCFTVFIGGGYLTIYPKLVIKDYIEADNNEIEVLNNELLEKIYKNNDLYYINNENIKIIKDLKKNEIPYLNKKTYYGKIFNKNIITIYIKTIHVPISYKENIKEVNVK